MRFREYFFINESKEEKTLALELADDADTLTSLNEVIPQNQKETDKLTLLAAYYYSKTKDLTQIKTDMRDYIGYVKNNRMPLITVDLLSNKPSHPWDDYIYWIQIIHGNQGEDAAKKKSNFRPSDIDLQNEKPFLTNSNGKIRVYKANNPQQCIILGKGQSFCISQPGNRMWQSYRDNQNSTFYFVYDDTRSDRLSIVVVDQTQSGTVLTDKVNTTGTTLDPYTKKLTKDSNSYMRYLEKKGIDVSKIVNIPKSSEEIEEHQKLSQTNKNLNWFVSLSSDYKSKYIGRGHLLTNEQFDHLFEHKFNSLLTQYVKTGLCLSDHQIEKIAKIRDLRDNYLHNRIIADQHTRNLTKKEYSLFSPKQKKSYYEKMNDDQKLEKSIKHGDLDIIKYLVDEKGAKIKYGAVSDASENGNLDLIKYLVNEKGAKIDLNAVSNAAISGNLDLVKYLVEKGAKISFDTLANAVSIGNLDIAKYLIEKGAEISCGLVSIAALRGNLDLVKYLVEKGAEIGDYAVYQAARSGNLDVVKYLVEKGGKISEDALANAVRSGNLDIADYLNSVKLDLVDG